MRAEQLSLGVTFVRRHARTGRSEKSHSTTLRNFGSRQDDKDRFATFQCSACKQGLCATKQTSRVWKQKSKRGGVTAGVLLVAERFVWGFAGFSLVGMSTPDNDNRACPRKTHKAP